MHLDRLGVKLASSALGLGHLPVAPGTWASAAAAVVYWLLRQRLAPVPCAVALAGLFLAALVLGLLVCPGAQKVYGEQDPGQFVLDEFAGLWLTCLVFWWRGPSHTAVAAFLAFRFFDIVKPFPVGRLEDVPGRWGVMLDDLAAAVCSAATLWAVCYGVIDKFVP